MATLPELRPNGDVSTTTGIPWTNDGTDTLMWQAIDDDPDSPDAADYADSDIVIYVGTAVLELTSTPANFDSMDTISIAGFFMKTGARVDDDVVFYVKIANAADTEDFVTEVQIAASDAGGDDTGLQTAGSITAAGKAASKADWDAARLHIRVLATKSKSWDSGTFGFQAIEVRGEFTEAGAAPQTISMVAATLASSAQGLNVSPGAISVPMSEATLVSAPQALSVDAPPPPVTVSMSTATLVGAPQALTALVSGGPLTISMAVATLVAAAQALNVDAATGATISMSVATLVAAAQSLSVVPGGVSIPLGDVELAGSAQALTVDSPISGTVIPMSAITLASAPQGLTVIPPDATIAMSPTTLVGSAQALTVKPGAVTIPLSAITLVSSAQALNVLPGDCCPPLSVITLQAQPQNLNVGVGETIIPMKAVTLVAALLTLNRVGLPPTSFFRIYALLGEHLPETAYNLQGEHIVEGTLEGEHIPETDVDIEGEV